MSWDIIFLQEAQREFDRLNESIKPQISKGIMKVAQNPLPRQEGGYGEPLGHRSGLDLTGAAQNQVQETRHTRYLPA